MQLFYKRSISQWSSLVWMAVDGKEERFYSEQLANSSSKLCRFWCCVAFGDVSLVSVNKIITEIRGSAKPLNQWIVMTVIGQCTTSRRHHFRWLQLFGCIWCSQIIVANESGDYCYWCAQCLPVSLSFCHDCTEWPRRDSASLCGVIQCSICQTTLASCLNLKANCSQKLLLCVWNNFAMKNS